MARDKIHEVVKKAVENDGWEITDDPLILLFEDDSIAIDLAAEKIIIAEKGTKKIAIEIKTFDQPSLIYEFHKAIGQYFNYQTALLEANENRELFVAIPETILNKLLQNHIIKKSIERIKMKLIVVNLETSKIVEWIN
jgi:hypothetical protein